MPRLAERRTKPDAPKRLGVKWNPQVGLWRAYAWIRGEGRQVHLGQFMSQEDAAMAHDRVELFLYGADASLNFPASNVEPATPQEVRDWALSLRAERIRQEGHPGARRRSRYFGVAWKKRAWIATIRTPDDEVRLPGFASEREAAIARDRVILDMGLALPLNEPKAARRLGPLSADECRTEQRQKRRPRPRSTSALVGVSRKYEGGPWVARAFGERVSGFASEIDAAVAHDRMVRAAGPAHVASYLNFPGRRLAAKTAEELRAQVRHERTSRQSSAHVGVAYNKRLGRWFARLHIDLRDYPLGLWSTEEDAAIAVDRAALFFGRDATNLPERSQSLGGASPADLRKLASAIIKESKTSRFRGVFWDEARGAWVAKIGHRYRSYELGTYDSEYEAAAAYDRAAVKMHKRRAKLNFAED